MNVYGGMTGAGRRVVKQAATKDWKCEKCGAALRYYWVSCPNDGTPRPKE